MRVANQPNHKARYQTYLENFIEAVNGKGQCESPEDGSCVYIRHDHPGCAIGCQPGFREAFSRFIDEDTGKIPSDLNTTSLDTLVVDHYKETTKALPRVKDDYNFLHALQDLHDQAYYWDDQFLCAGAVEAFCRNWGLTYPASLLEESS